MPKWEYRVDLESHFDGRDALVKWLSDAGQNGWELTSAVAGERDIIFIFKRLSEGAK